MGEEADTTYDDYEDYQIRVVPIGGVKLPEGFEEWNREQEEKMAKEELLQQADEYKRSKFAQGADERGLGWVNDLIKALADELRGKEKDVIPGIVDISEPLPQEKTVLECLEALKREFEHRSKPLVEHLCRLQSMRIPKYITNPNIIIDPLPQPPG